MQTVYFETVGDRHLQKIGGVTVLERRIREVARRGATHVVVAAERVDFGRPLPVVLEFVSRRSTIPEGVKVERADVVEGVELVDAAAVARVEDVIVRGLNDGDEGIIDMRVRRPVARRLTRALARRAVRPARLMVAAAIVGLAAAAIVVIRHDAWGYAIAGVVLEASAMLEAAVRRLARLTFRPARYAAVGRAVVDSAFVVAIGGALGGGWLPLALGAAAVMPWRAPRPGVLRALGQRDAFVFFAMVSCVIGVPAWVVIDGCVMAAVNVISLVYRRRGA